MDLTTGQKEILAAKGHLLITGGPGSGKTTVAILKAGQIAGEELRPGQEVLFLSFARATVSRVLEAIEEENHLSADAKKRIAVDTYHAFFWQIIKTHGYLLGLPRRLSLLTPPNEHVALSDIRSRFKADKKLSPEERAQRESLEDAERRRLAMSEGSVCFSLFAEFAYALLNGSDKLRKQLSIQYPVVVLDEFQDTNLGQWDVVRAIGLNSTLIALADPEQRIFDFIGADPKRLDQFRSDLNPAEFTLGAENHRSKGTEIGLFGNEVLTGKFRQSLYQGINIVRFQLGDNNALVALVNQTLKARERLLKSDKRGWSIAVLVPTKALTRHVSEIFQYPLGTLPSIQHTAVVDMEAAILAAEIIAFLLQPQTPSHFNTFVELLCGYYRGKGGDVPGVTNIKAATAIETANIKYRAAVSAGKRPSKASVINKMVIVYNRVCELKLTGVPDQDWKTVRTVLDGGECPRLKEVADDARNVRLLERGTQLRQTLALDWRTFGAYRNALAITQAAFVHEHFASANKPESGIVVMNMHKAKGKQFDEVIIFERGPRIQNRKIVANIDRFVRNNDPVGDLGQARQSFRVSVTRARQRTTILTPAADPCVLLP